MLAALRLSNVTQGLSRSAACGILAPRPGIEPEPPPALAGGFLTSGPPGKSSGAFCKKQSSANEQGTQWICFFLTLKSAVDRLVSGAGHLLL